MLCVLQLGLAALGVATMRKETVRFGGQVCGGPFPALIGLVELLTAIGGTVREGERDLLALKAIGLSPRQITAITVTATGCTALAAVLAGTALGAPLAHWLIDSQGRSSGIGAGIAQSPSPLLLVLFGAAAVLGAAALAALPAARAARRRLADTLSAVA